MKLEIELSDDVARSLAVIASDKNIGMDTLASIVVCNYVVSRPTPRAADGAKSREDEIWESIENDPLEDGYR